MNQPANIQPAMALEDILNLERYPIDRLESPEGQAVVELAREGLISMVVVAYRTSFDLKPWS